MKQKEKVLVAMSGGVDSSVAAALLLDKGNEVTGAFMVNYQSSSAPSGLRPASFADQFTGRSVAETCWIGDYRDALRVAAKLGIPLLKLDFTKEYNDLVLNYMYREYEAGRTPNPDVMCNKFVKFGVWLDKARSLGFDKLATGHYARLEREIQNSKFKIQNFGQNKLQVTSYKLQIAKDDNKDQTYFLHQLTQDQLSHVLFPIGEYTKDEVREIARQKGLPTAEKEESMGICFIGEVPMKEFLSQRIKPTPGRIIFSQTGEVVGEHQGLPFYTIGQRHIGVESGKWKVESGDSKPLYVINKDLKENRLIVGYENDLLLYKKEIVVKDVNWISGQTPDFPLKCKVRLRHRQEMQNAQLKMQNGELAVLFDEPQRAITPGQFAVFYRDEECLGGGVIE